MTDQTSLAVNNGSKVRSEPWPRRQLFGEEEKQAVVRLFDRAAKENYKVLGYNGPEERAYCDAFAELLGGGFADGVNSGTNALYIALRALELAPYTEVIVPPVSDPGGVMPVPLVNCIPVPADSVPDSYNTGAEQIKARITNHTSAIVVAHIAGIPADMDPIMQLARSRNLLVIEDCAQAHGTRYKGKPVGTLADIAIFSTMIGKHYATAGQGGVVFTQNEEYYSRILRYADRGKPFGLDAARTNVVASLNCNMDELHAAIGQVQLRKLPAIVNRRRQLAESIAKGCQDSVDTVRLVCSPDGCQASYWFMLFKLDLSKIRVDKRTFVESLAAEGIPASPDYKHIPMQLDWARKRAVFGDSGLPWSNPLYKGDADAEYPLPNIEATDARHFRVAFHEDCTSREVQDLIKALRKVEKAYLA